jgi:hypothetical protein
VIKTGNLEAGNSLRAAKSFLTRYSSDRNASTVSSIIMSSVRKEAKKRPNVRYPFWFGGSASCFAACVTHPLDLGKDLSTPEGQS